MPGQINIPLQHSTCWYWQNNNNTCSTTPVRPCFCCLLQTYNIRCLSYSSPAFQLSLPEIPPRMLKNSLKNYALGMNERKMSPAMWIWIWLGPELLPHSEIIQGESWVFLAASLLSIELLCHGTERPRSEEREGRDQTAEWRQKGHFDETCRCFCPGEFSFPLWPQRKMSQAALRYPAWLGRGVKSGLSKVVAWGILKTKAQAKPCTGITPNCPKTQNQEFQGPSNSWVGL